MVIDPDDTDDLVQDVFIKIYKNIESFNASSSLYTWIYRIAANETLTFLKRKKRRSMVSLSIYSHQLSESLQSDQHFSGDEIQKKLQQAILQLPPKQQLVFNMRYFDELKYDEISGILDISTGSLKASYHHAVKKIEKYFTGD